MEDFLPKQKQPMREKVRDEKEEIEAEVRGIIRSVLKVEDEAAEIKRGKPLLKHERLY